ncbi:MAG: hypothetical protein HZB56_14160 [Deltaproteobacteria bacterium]|nr:hypothetical protein [Deltaproteobacteria bacterium]
MIRSARWTLAVVTLLAPLLLAPAARGSEEGGRDGRHPYRFWIGEAGPTEGPLGLGPKQRPFVCATVESGLGQPLVDNQAGRGSAVFPEVGGVPDFAATPVGYSEDCSILTRVDYFYWDGAAAAFRRFDPATMFDAPPPGLARIPVGGQAVPFVVRVETGTLDRFLYTIAMLAPWPEEVSSPGRLRSEAWNRKLVYWFRGGVGIGHWQGEAAWHGGLWGAERAIFPGLLAQGYAIATSSANETGVHYNLRLAEEAMLMVKGHLVETYGRPRYTVGLGGSGGGIQQYAIGQNHPGLLDAGIPLYSYPDMVTQTIHVGDCNLLEQYFLEDVMSKGAASKWAVWSRRQWIEGLNASDTVRNSVFGTPGSSECIEGWFFAEPLAMNPRFTDPQYFAAFSRYRFPAAEVAAIRWTHWNDLENIYGVDAAGFAPVPFDNVGVQYGLRALVEGKITPAEFVELNACVGSWKEQADYVAWNPYADPFDASNARRNPVACRMPLGAGWAPSPRRAGDLSAMRRAYTSGHVFTGDIEIPLVDLRPYLEPELNMHNARQSFSARERMRRGEGRGRNQVIWFTGSEADVPARIQEALGVLDAWLTTGRRPPGFVDKCTDASGNLIAAGRQVWDGILDRRPPGACTLAYPLKSSSRMVAGDGYAGDLFKCARKPLARALEDGTYGAVAFTDGQLSQLDAIFPDGVCDYTRPDVGRPRGWGRGGEEERDEDGR